MSSKTTIWILFGVAVLLSIVFLASLREAGRIRKNAEAFLADLQKMKINQTPAADVRLLANKYRRYSTTDSCPSSDSCFSFDNGWLMPIHLGHPARLRGGWRIVNGRLVSIGFGYVTGIAEAARCYVDVDELDSPLTTRTIAINNRRDGTGRLWQSIVKIGPAASDEQRRLAFTPDLSCLSRIEGPPRLARFGPQDLVREFTVPRKRAMILTQRLHLTHPNLLVPLPHALL